MNRYDCHDGESGLDVADSGELVYYEEHMMVVRQLQSRLEELNQKVTALQQENASLKQDAERFRKLAYLMRFDKEGDYVTMDLVCPVDATYTHDVIGDWMEPALTESVRRTVDASM